MNSIRSIITAVVLATLSQFALAVPVDFSGDLSASDPKYNRTLSGNPPTGLSNVGTDVSYDVFAFHVTRNGDYVMSTLTASFATGTSDDTFITLYQTAFNSASPLTNALQADDDSGTGFLSEITQSLNASTNYFLVVTSFDNGQFGNYTGQFYTVPINDGDLGGQVILGTVPEPASMALIGLGLLGLGFSKRKKASQTV